MFSQRVAMDVPASLLIVRSAFLVIRVENFVWLVGEGVGEGVRVSSRVTFSIRELKMKCITMRHK